MFDDIGGYRLNVRGVEDWDFWVAAGVRGHLAQRIARPLFHYQQSDDGVLAQEVATNIEAKFAQVVLNNAVAYQPSYVAWAFARLNPAVVAPVGVCQAEGKVLAGVA